MTTSPYNIKSVYENLVSLLPHIINSYISENLFLVQWKMAKISPIPKSDDPQNFDDYRPVSVSPLFSKVYERLIAKQLCTFLERSCTLKDTTAGFQKSHSTNTIFFENSWRYFACNVKRRTHFIVLPWLFKSFRYSSTSYSYPKAP